MILDPWVRDIKSTEQVVENSERGDEAKAEHREHNLRYFLSKLYRVLPFFLLLFS